MLKSDLCPRSDQVRKLEIHFSEEVFMTDAIHRVTEKLHKPTKNHNTRTNNGIYRLAKRSF